MLVFARTVTYGTLDIISTVTSRIATLSWRVTDTFSTLAEITYVAFDVAPDPKSFWNAETNHGDYA